MGTARLAIVTTHPIQYYAPWFRWMASNASIDVRVFYLWDFGVVSTRDRGFQEAIEWDVPLLAGYESEFVPNTSGDPGTHHYFGMRNPQLAARLRKFRPDAALLIGYRYASMMRLILTPASRRPYPLLFRGDSHRLVQRNSATLKTEMLRRELRRRAIRMIYARFAACLYVGQANRGYFRLHGVPEERLFFSPHAVENERFMSDPGLAREEGVHWRRKLGISDDQLLVMFAGKFEEKKRPLDLLAAFARLRRSDVSLVFVGSGPLDPDLRRAAAALPNVFFAPFQNQSKMPRTYAACDLFVLPSYGAEESWGLAINEALCLARPVIVSSHVGCAADLVRVGQNGWIFSAGDAGALADVLEQALSDRQRLVAFGDAGREIVSTYSYDAATRGLFEAVSYVTGSAAV